MIVAQGWKRPTVQPNAPAGYFPPFHDFPDSCQRQSFEAAGDRNAARNGEQQFVLFSAVQRLFEGGSWEPGRIADIGLYSGSEANPP